MRPLARARKQVPEAGTEVGPAEDRVERDAEPEDRRADICAAHDEPPAAGASGGGPYGTSTCPASPSRQRRDRPRSTSTVITPSAVYRAIVSPKTHQSPWAGVTASAVRM